MYTRIYIYIICTWILTACACMHVHMYIKTGGHVVADGLRNGSEWLAGKMVKKTEKFSAWLGPAKKEVEVSEKTEKRIAAVQKGSEQLLGITTDIVSGLDAVAVRGVAWAADKVSDTETYKEWEKKPSGQIQYL